MGASSRYYPKLTPPPHPGPPTAREPPHRVSGADILTVIENSGQRSRLSRVAGTIEGHATAAWPCTGCSLKSAKDWDKPRLRRGLSRRSGQTRDGCLWCSRPFWAPCLVPRYTPVLSAVTDNLSPRSRSCFGVARWHLAACQHLAVVFPASKLANHKARLSEVGGVVCGGVLPLPCSPRQSGGGRILLPERGINTAEKLGTPLMPDGILRVGGKRAAPGRAGWSRCNLGTRRDPPGTAQGG